VLQKIENLNRAEFNYRRNLVANAYDYFNPALDISAQVGKERRILERLANVAGRRLLVRTPDPIDYASLVFNALVGAVEQPGSVG
jgi:hypothetical protein